MRPGPAHISDGILPVTEDRGITTPALGMSAHSAGVRPAQGGREHLRRGPPPDVLQPGHVPQRPEHGRPSGRDRPGPGLDHRSLRDEPGPRRSNVRGVRRAQDEWRVECVRAAHQHRHQQQRHRLLPAAASPTTSTGPAPGSGSRSWPSTRATARPHRARRQAPRPAGSDLSPAASPALATPPQHDGPWAPPGGAHRLS